jgi:hypothetical protein
MDVDVTSLRSAYLRWASYRNYSTHVIVNGMMCGDSQVTGMCSCEQQGEGEWKLYKRNMNLMLK